MFDAKAACCCPDDQFLSDATRIGTKYPESVGEPNRFGTGAEVQHFFGGRALLRKSRFN